MALRGQPYLPLYVQDFMTDEKLIECSAESVGVYIRLMCVLHKSEEYGTLTLNSRNEKTGEVCYDFARKLLRYLPYEIETINRGLRELIDNDVIQINGNTLSQKRMVRDGEISAARATAGLAGGKSKAERSKTPSKSASKILAKVVANAETATVIDNDNNNVVPRDGFLSDSEADELSGNAEQLNAVFDAAERAGFPHTQADLDRLNQIVADYHPEPVLNAIDRAVDAGTTTRTWRYLLGILKSDPTGGTRERTNDDQRLPPMIGVE